MDTDQLRIRYGFWVVVMGFVLVGAVFAVAVWKWNTATDVTAVVGAVTGMVGTIVGALTPRNTKSTKKKIGSGFGLHEAWRLYGGVGRCKPIM